jgi:hypothetical protein
MPSKKSNTSGVFLENINGNISDSSSDTINKDLTGVVQGVIGTGENAKTGIAYSVLKWLFWLTTGITVIVIINCIFFRRNEKTPDIMNDIKFVWDIVTPLITLILGYVFGKSKY